jgi:hypothetical protein
MEYHSGEEHGQVALLVLCDTPPTASDLLLSPMPSTTRRHNRVSIALQ